LKEYEEEELGNNKHADKGLLRLLRHPVEPFKGKPLHPHRHLPDLDDDRKSVVTINQRNYPK
jgi:hypothetical protein